MKTKEIFEHPIVSGIIIAVIVAFGAILWNLFQQLDFGNPHIIVIIILVFFLILSVLHNILCRLKVQPDEQIPAHPQPHVVQSIDTITSSSYNIVQDYLRWGDVDIPFKARISKLDPSQYSIFPVEDFQCPICHNSLQHRTVKKSWRFYCHECDKWYGFHMFDDFDADPSKLDEYIEEYLQEKGLIIVED